MTVARSIWMMVAPRRLVALAVVALPVVSLALAGCADTAVAPPQAGQDRAQARQAPAPPVLEVRQHGLTAELPPGWQSAAESLTPHLVDPREELAVATFPLRYRQTECAQIPGSALADLGPGDAFVTLQERGLGAADGPDFPARPARFGPELGGPFAASGCVGDAHFTDHWFGFTDGGRAFHVIVAFGPQASAEVQRQAWAILDGLRVDPAVVPDWRSSG
jgi:hypothetical protein